MGECDLKQKLNGFELGYPPRHYHTTYSPCRENPFLAEENFSFSWGLAISKAEKTKLGTIQFFFSSSPVRYIPYPPLRRSSDVEWGQSLPTTVKEEDSEGQGRRAGRRRGRSLLLSESELSQTSSSEALPFRVVGFHQMAKPGNRSGSWRDSLPAADINQKGEILMVCG